MLKKIVIKGAKEHNLKNVSVEIPKDKLFDFGVDHSKIGSPCYEGDTIWVDYTGMLPNGEIFDTTIDGEKFNFHVGKGEVIECWDNAFQ